MDKITILKKENIRPFLEKLAKSFDVYLPIRNMDKAVIEFMHIDALAEPNDGKLSINLEEKTGKSPKSIFFPSTETLFEFEYLKDIQKPDTTNIRIDDKSGYKNETSRRKLIFGLKPCDTRGIRSLDMVFNENGKQDAYYSDKRADSILISIGCNIIFPDCFCPAVNGDPFDFKYSDIGFIDLEDCLAVLKVSEDGSARKILEDCGEYFEEMDFDKNMVDRIEKIKSASMEKFEGWVKNADGISSGNEMEKDFNNSDAWQKISDKCVGCAACTYVCPTCVCYSISDETYDMNGERYRCWDYCTNYNYTLEASGHNPRSRVYQRYRNKINCKFNYFYKRNKMLYCIGCGRCAEVCPVGMDIRDIIVGFSNKHHKI
jgi:sulfhydrogenase subunit beta (sulfur reductase)